MSTRDIFIQKQIFLKRGFVIIKRNTILCIIGTCLLASTCTIQDDITDDLEPPFINLDKSSTLGNTSTIEFSAYNKEGNFAGYNVWYGSENAIINGHRQKNRNMLVLKRQSPLDASIKEGVLSLSNENLANIPSVKNETTTFNITINNTSAGDYIFITAYSHIDNIDSPLSNPYIVP